MPSLPTIALIAIISLCTIAQSQPPPKQEKPGTTAPTDSSKTDYSQEALVIEHSKLSYRFEKDGTGVRELNFRARIQSDAAVQQFGQLIFPYSSANEKFEVNYIRVKKPDGTIVSSTINDVQDLSAPIAREAPIYTDLRQKHVTVRGLRPGDVLEYNVVWKLTSAYAPNHFWLEHNFFEPGTIIALDEQLELNIPKESKVKLKTGKGKDAVIKDLEDRRIYSWKFASLKRIEKDKDEETKKKPDTDEDELNLPDVQVSTFQSWAEVGEWYAGLERDRITPDDKVKAKTTELVKGLATEKEKIEALYSYVAKNFRYVSLSLGRGRYQPQAASDVIANEYGDCKDKHTLLSAMLASAGLRGNAVLINSSRKIDPEVPSPGQFDHVITAVPLTNETLWMDTTAEVAPFRLLSPRLRDKQALMVPAASPARLETTPAEPPFRFTENVEFTGEVNELGKLTGKAHFSLRGDSELLLRVLFRNTPKSEWERIGYYLALMSGSPGSKITDINPTDPAAFDRPFEINYSFTDDNFLNWSSKKETIKVPLPTMNIPLVNADSQDGTKPIQLGPPIDLIHKLTLKVPAKYQTRIPLPLKVSRDYAEYSSHYKLEGNVLTVERKYRSDRRELPAERTQDFLAFSAAAKSDESQVVALETDVAGTPAIPATVKVEELMQAATAASENENYPLVEELLRRVLEKEPKHKEARQQLGGVLFEQEKYDDAIKHVSEQIKINPFDSYSYNLMGRAYWAKGNHQEAEGAFRKQLEITPLDKWAKSNLAQVLIDSRKFKEAIPELEQAISLNPDSQPLYIGLGRAYLNTNQTAKGIEMFDKAVRLEPGPYVWNSVAYNLSLSKVQLDKAQQYAESAVTSVATELRNVELAQLSPEDLIRVPSIAAYWDTLGWVHYQQGHIELAEKYIRASWYLNPHSEVGAHLAEILEKAGKSADAVRMYALAVYAPKVVPEAIEGFNRLVPESKRSLSQFDAAKELTELRTIKFASGLKNAKAVEGEFFILLAPGPSGAAKIVDLKVLKGGEKASTFIPSLKTANFNFVFPDSTSTRLIRKGTLYCEPGGECKFILLTPDNVTSVE